jgi:hypothetical protein
MLRAPLPLGPERTDLDAQERSPEGRGPCSLTGVYAHLSFSEGFRASKQPLAPEMTEGIRDNRKQDEQHCDRNNGSDDDPGNAHLFLLC